MFIFMLLATVTICVGLYYYLTHCSRTGRLLNNLPGPSIYPFLGNALALMKHHNYMERVCDLMTYHKELEQEELFLTALLSKLDKQIHALQVEQLHLLNAGKNSLDLNSQNNENTGASEGNESPESKHNSSVENGQELDLRPIKKFDVSEFEEEEEEEDDKVGEEHFPENSADFDYL